MAVTELTTTETKVHTMKLNDTIYAAASVATKKN